MSVRLQKNQKVNLSKDNNSLKAINVCLGWLEAQEPQQPTTFLGILISLFSPIPYPDQTIDVDAAVMLWNANDINEKDIVAYFNLNHKSGKVKHYGDDLVGASSTEGPKDCEKILIRLSELPKNYNRITVVAAIYKALDKDQCFSEVKNAFIRIVDNATDKELYRYDLTNDVVSESTTAVRFGDFTRNEKGEWEFKIIADEYRCNYLTEMRKLIMERDKYR